jgi:hypothetical protein
VALITHHTGVPKHMQASLPLTPIHYCYILIQIFDTVLLFNIMFGCNLSPFAVIQSMTVTRDASYPLVASGIWFPPFEIHSITAMYVEINLQFRLHC